MNTKQEITNEAYDQAQLAETLVECHIGLLCQQAWTVKSISKAAIRYGVTLSQLTNHLAAFRDVQVGNVRQSQLQGDAELAECYQLDVDNITTILSLLAS